MISKFQGPIQLYTRFCSALCFMIFMSMLISMPASAQDVIDSQLERLAAQQGMQRVANESVRAGEINQNQMDFSWIDTYGKSPTEFTDEEWLAIIDAQWGSGIATSEKLALFDTWWNEINTRFGAWHGLDLDIEALRDLYRPEIEAGVSKGRFSGIMNHFTYQLEELHTYLFDIPVRNTAMIKGVPMMNFGQYGNASRFGALLSPLDDSTLVVYEVIPNHPIALERGDKVLGYDNVLWKDIYPRLLEAELPLFLLPTNANTDEANYHYAMQSAGLNWHLFDTIDVVKHSSGDTLHYDTNLLSGQTIRLWGKDQIAPPGVPWPNRTLGSRIGWGIINETNVGMITVTSWTFDAQFDIRNKFEQAVKEMMIDHDADGIIFDFRFNTGGGALAREGLQWLFNENVPTVGFDQRIPGSVDPLAMEPDPQRFEANLVIQGRTDSFYDKPIAILIGPGAISAGELEARRLSFHPQARIFGLPASASNTGSDFINIGDDNWFVSRAHSAQYLASDHSYISHIALQPDERVWFTQEDVANGVDTVIKSALTWIDAEITASEDEVVFEEDVSVDSYPNPFQDQVTLSFDLAATKQVSLAIFDVLGRRVATLADEQTMRGAQRVVWNGEDLNGKSVVPGVYFWRFSTGEQSKSGMMTLMR